MTGIDIRAIVWGERMLLHFDPKDHFFYNAIDLASTQQKRDNFIDGLAWGSATLASCLLNPTEVNVLIASHLCSYIENLNKVGGHVGRFARTYRNDDPQGDEYQVSRTMPGYKFVDGQAKAGPVALTLAALAAAKSADPIMSDVRKRVLKLYREFILQFVEDEYQIRTASGQVAEYGDLRPWGISGCFHALLVYVMLRVGVVVCELLGDQNGSSSLKAKQVEVWCSTWAKRSRTIIRTWTLLMGTWNCWLHRKVGKFSNDNLIFLWLAIWSLIPGEVDADKLREIQECADYMRSMVKPWRNSFFTVVYSLLLGDRAADASVSEWLDAYPEDRRKQIDGTLTKKSEICPVEKRKPTAWSWRANPDEWSEPGTKFGLAYSPADWLTAYNFAKFAGMLKDTPA